MIDVEAVFAADGPLAQALPGYAPRSQQQVLAGAVAEAISQQTQLLAEAGTGIGKTFAYLVPALLSGARVIISTGTRHLQDQLYHRDLPLVRRALGHNGRIALLKGRANYLCRHRLQLALEQVEPLAPLTRSHLALIEEWARATDSGDMSRCAGLPEDSPAWALATSTIDNCLGQECPVFGDCCVVQARRRAQQADLVVVNHHLFCADLALKEDGFGEVLPSANAFVFDEAHQLPEVASAFFGDRISSRQLLDLARDSVAEQLREAPDMGDIRMLARQLETRSSAFRLSLGRFEQRHNWRQIGQREPVAQALAELDTALAELLTLLELGEARGRGLEACTRRARALRQRLGVFIESQDEDQILWCETSRQGYALQRTPLDVGDAFRRRLESYPAAWIFTSATLAVGEDFEHFRSRLALTPSRSLRLDSPFDFRHQALLYLPPAMPEPKQPDYDQRVIDAVRPVLLASAGRAFLLFTSHRALQLAAAELRRNGDFTLLVQGEAPKAELLQLFTTAPRAVLLGTASFWEGVDVRGEALSVVVIDKLPFAAPSDPVLQARLESIRRQGGNPFMSFQLPQAVLTLKQGVGRLIRDVQDRGVLVLCDPRLRTSRYGRIFLESLPPMPVSERIEDVDAFFSRGD